MNHNANTSADNIQPKFQQNNFPSHSLMSDDPSIVLHGSQIPCLYPPGLYFRPRHIMPFQIQPVPLFLPVDPFQCNFSFPPPFMPNTNDAPDVWMTSPPFTRLPFPSQFLYVQDQQLLSHLPLDKRFETEGASDHQLGHPWPSAQIHQKQYEQHDDGTNRESKIKGVSVENNFEKTFANAVSLADSPGGILQHQLEQQSRYQEQQKLPILSQLSHQQLNEQTVQISLPHQVNKAALPTQQYSRQHHEQAAPTQLSQPKQQHEKTQLSHQQQPAVKTQFSHQQQVQSHQSHQQLHQAILPTSLSSEQQPIQTHLSHQGQQPEIQFSHQHEAQTELSLQHHVQRQPSHQHVHQPNVPTHLSQQHHQLQTQLPHQQNPTSQLSHNQQNETNQPSHQQQVPTHHSHHLNHPVAHSQLSQHQLHQPAVQNHSSNQQLSQPAAHTRLSNQQKPPVQTQLLHNQQHESNHLSHKQLQEATAPIAQQQHNIAQCSDTKHVESQTVYLRKETMNEIKHSETKGEQNIIAETAAAIQSNEKDNQKVAQKASGYKTVIHNKEDMNTRHKTTDKASVNAWRGTVDKEDMNKWHRTVDKAKQEQAQEMATNTYPTQNITRSGSRHIDQQKWKTEHRKSDFENKHSPNYQRENRKQLDHKRTNKHEQQSNHYGYMSRTNDNEYKQRKQKTHHLQNLHLQQQNSLPMPPLSWTSSASSRFSTHEPPLPPRFNKSGHSSQFNIDRNDLRTAGDTRGVFSHDKSVNRSSFRKEFNQNPHNSIVDSQNKNPCGKSYWNSQYIRKAS